MDLNGDVYHVIYCRGARNQCSFMTCHISCRMSPRTVVPVEMARHVANISDVVSYHHTLSIHLSSLDKRHESIN